MSDLEGTLTWRALLAEATERCATAGMTSPGVDARRIVERASGMEGAELVLGLDEPATQRAVGEFDHLLWRRVGGEPLQYVVGHWGFRSLDLLVDRRVLIPRPETESVAEAAIAEVAGRPAPVVADLGTGSGAIALSIAVEVRTAEVWATDASPDALDVARANLAGIGRPGARVRLAEGDWFAALPDDLRGGLDVVVANPPYVAATDELPPEVADWEPDDALVAGPTGLEDLERIVDEAPGWLAPGGALVLELAPAHAEVVADRARAAGFEGVEVRADLAGRLRTLVARRP